MGVSGLLPVLRPIQNTKSLTHYAGKCLAIDGYAWLHRAVYTCTWELSHELPTLKYLEYIKRRINLLINVFKIEPYFVFDGDNFGSKSLTEENRKIQRDLNKKLGEEWLLKNNQKKAREYFAKSVDVSPEIAKTVIDFLKTSGIKYVVAPYEADSQMVYMEKIGLVDGIISEDSDLLIFGCQRLLTKFNDKDGTVIEISKTDFKLVSEHPIGIMTDNQLRMVATLSGCDYTPGIPKIGMIKALQYVKNYHSMDKILLKLKYDKFQVSNDFLYNFRRAELSFLYPRVFNPIENKMTTLNEIPDNLTEEQLELIDEENCLGELLELQIHQKIAKGELNPITKEPLISRESMLLSKSIVSNNTNNQRSIKRFQTSPVVTKSAKTIDLIGFFSSSQKSSVQAPTILPSSTTRSYSTALSSIKDTSMVSKKIFKFSKSNSAKGASELGLSKFFKKVNKFVESSKEETLKNKEAKIEDEVISSDLEEEISDSSLILIKNKMTGNENNILFKDVPQNNIILNDSSKNVEENLLEEINKENIKPADKETYDKETHLKSKLEIETNPENSKLEIKENSNPEKSEIISEGENDDLSITKCVVVTNNASNKTSIRTPIKNFNLECFKYTGGNGSYQYTTRKTVKKSPLVENSNLNKILKNNQNSRRRIAGARIRNTAEYLLSHKTDKPNTNNNNNRNILGAKKAKLSLQMFACPK